MNLPETGFEDYNWTEDGIYQLDVLDWVNVGPGGKSNRQATELAIRTRNLHIRLLLVEEIDPETIIGTIRGGVSADLDTLLKIKEWVEQQLAGLDTSALTANVLTTIRGGVATDFDTLNKLKSWIDNQFTGAAVLDDNLIDWSSRPVRTKTLTAATTLTFSNLIVNKTITLVVTGAYSLELPASVCQISGEYKGEQVNLIQLLCVNSTTPEVWCVISQKLL
jgi:hypothetical protein